MQAIKATFQDGQVILNDTVNIKGRYDAVLVLLDEDPWDALIKDPTPRLELIKARQDAEKAYAEGNVTPLDPDKMP